MNKNFTCTLLVVGTMFITTAQAQSDKFAYTVTDSVQNGVKWNFLRNIDLRTGDFSGILLRLLNSNDTIANSTLCNGVAAIALDDKNRRLYYTPMLMDRLSYVDLRTMRTHVVTNNYTGLMPKATDQSNIITRMVVGADDHVYALTNDGNHLIRFNSRNNRIKDLGQLTDARNNTVSVHEVCSSYGGDMISGDDGILYLITSRNHIFKINIETRVARYQGTISGLPESFTTSGAAVDYRGNHRVVISSAVDASDIYSVDLRSLAAVGLHGNNVWHSSDLTNGNSLKNKDDDLNDAEIFVNADQLYIDKIRIYPNPVTMGKFKIKFPNADVGIYNVALIDVLGETVSVNSVHAFGKNTIVDIELPASISKGIYIVRITDKMNKTVFSEKIILQ